MKRKSILCLPEIVLLTIIQTIIHIFSVFKGRGKKLMFSEKPQTIRVLLHFQEINK